MKNSMELLAKLGAVLVRTKRHNVWRLPNGTTLTTSKSPSDFRAEANRLREIRHKMKMIDPAPKLKPGKRKERRKRISPNPQQSHYSPPRSSKPSSFRGKLAHAITDAGLSVKATFHRRDKMKLNKGKDNELRPKGDSAIEKSWAFAPAYSEDGKTLSYATRIRELLELLRVGWTQPVYAPKEAPDCTTSFVSSYTGVEKRFRFHWDHSRHEDKLLITRIK